MINAGRSFSGQERNCIFLNPGASQAARGRFADVSSATGLDFDDDHPLLRLLEESADWLLPLWPALVALFDARMQHPGAPEGDEEEEEGQGFGSHDDLVP